MAEVAVFASGSGSNFEAIVTSLAKTEHSVCCLVCDRHEAPVFERAKRLGIPAYHVSYFRRSRVEAEQEIIDKLGAHRPSYIALAGFMRILSPFFVDTFPHKIVNIHPALLPAHPGAHGLQESYLSDDEQLGITIHYVDHGTDTGPIIRRQSIHRNSGETLETAERRIHSLEHHLYPDVICSLLDAYEKQQEAG